MSLPVTIARLTPNDWESHRDLRLEALATDPQAFGATYADNAAYDEATWRARLAAVTYWQARQDGMPLGMVGLWDPSVGLGEQNGDDVDPEPAASFLIAMYVRPLARGGGVGDALVVAVLADAAARGHRHVVLDVREANAAARALYARHGFVVTPDREQRQVAGDCEITMVLDLAGWPV